MNWERLMPITADTVTVNGYRTKPNMPTWRGLNWCDVIVAHEAQLSVGWMHPKDQEHGHAADTEMWVRYRVRPRRKGYRFEATPDEPTGWRLVKSS